MLELAKTILPKVSFDSFLFQKELKKFVEWLNADEMIAFKAGCIAVFGVTYADVLKDVFSN